MHFSLSLHLSFKVTDLILSEGRLSYLLINEGTTLLLDFLRAKLHPSLELVENHQRSENIKILFNRRVEFEEYVSLFFAGSLCKFWLS